MIEPMSRSPVAWHTIGVVASPVATGGSRSPRSPLALLGRAGWSSRSSGGSGSSWATGGNGEVDRRMPAIPEAAWLHWATSKRPDW
jgi:hypothetical protein